MQSGSLQNSGNPHRGQTSRTRTQSFGSGFAQSSRTRTDSWRQRDSENN